MRRPGRLHGETIGIAKRWGVVFLLAAAFAVSILDRTILNLLIEPIKRDLAISDTEIGLVAGLGFALFYAVFGLLAGRLADRFNRRTIIVAGISLWSFATASAGLAGSFLQLLLSRAGVAVGEATLSPASFSMIADMFPARRLGRAISVYYMGGTIGPGLALIAGGGLIAFATDMPVDWLNRFAVWQRVMILAGLPGLAIALLLYLFVREPVRRADAVQASPTANVPLQSFVQHLVEHWRVYAPIFLGITLSSIYFNGLHTWAPAFFMRVYHWTPGETARALGVAFAVAGTLGALSGGALSDAFFQRGRKEAPLLAMTIMAAIATPASIVATRIDTHADWALAGLSVVFFSIASFNAIAPSAIQLVTPNRMRARTSALYLMLVSIVAVSGGPLFVGMLNDRVFSDPQSVGRSLSVVAIAVMPVTLVIFARGRRFYRQAVLVA